MRRWGYGLVGLVVVFLFFGAIQNPEQTESALPTTSSSQLSAEPSSSAESSGSPSQTDTPGETENQIQEEANPESSSRPRPTSTQTQEAEASVEDEVDEPTPSSIATPSPTPTPSPSATPTPTRSVTPEPTPTPTQTAAAPAPSVNIFEQLLAQLRIEDEFPTGYDRDLFRHWIDADGDGCDARREVLIAEAIEAPSVGSRCSLTGGRWFSVYDGVTTDDPSTFDIDHMVALKEAWDSGAHAWSSDKRRAFANDLDLPEALIAVSASSNRSKSDRDPADWLPPLASYHCQYIRDWMVVKIKWELSVDAREFNAIRSVAAGC